MEYNIFCDKCGKYVIGNKLLCDDCSKEKEIKEKDSYLFSNRYL
jgi:uncharacterized OB-fold protein